MIEAAIKKALKRSVHHPELLKVMDYAVFPAGKLFRPRLVEAIALDLDQKLTEDHLHLASAIELHHAYTLVHDDLPSMDNDLIRRGKPSTHAHFGEWKAILAGDALLISSFQELMEMKTPHVKDLHRLMTWATGAKGLIEGQYTDLLADGKLDIRRTVRIHELKTGRLIQLATLGSYLLHPKRNFRGKIDFLKLGREIGVSFQLLDDLNELAVSEVSSHERDINPFFQNHSEALKELKKSHLALTSLLLKWELNSSERMLHEYFKKNQDSLLDNFDFVEKHVGKNLTDLRNWITSFV
jgi:geranylgeranyl pyrophosphate synthase